MEGEHPIAYFSRMFLPREEQYSTVEECLAIKLGIQTFRVYLLGKPFMIQTDHRSLVWLDRLKENNAHLTRWSLALQPYQFTVQHQSGKANGNADALSHVDLARQIVMSPEKGGRVRQSRGTIFSFEVYGLHDLGQYCLLLSFRKLELFVFVIGLLCHLLEL